MPDKTLADIEVECLKLKAALNENHRLAQKSATDAIERALLSGDTLVTWKKLLPHGKFEPFVEKHFDGSLRTARNYMQAHKGLSSLPKRQATAVLMTEDSMEGLLKRLKKDDSSGTGNARKAATILGTSAPVPSGSISETGRPGGGSSPSSTVPPASAAPEPGEAADSSGEEGTERETSSQETDPRPPRSGKDKPGTGKCPNCRGSRWSQDENGFSCAKCLHPWGEPADSQPEEKKDNGDDLRAKAAKTMEAAMRVFDDLNMLVPKAGLHKQVIELCKNLLKSAKGWK